MLWVMRKFLEDYRKAAAPPSITTATFSNTTNAVRFGAMRLYKITAMMSPPVAPIAVLGPRP